MGRKSVDGALTERQKEIVQVVETLTEQLGYPPTAKMVAEVVGNTAGAIRSIYAYIEKKGYMFFPPGRPGGYLRKNKDGHEVGLAYILRQPKAP